MKTTTKRHRAAAPDLLDVIVTLLGCVVVYLLCWLVLL